MRKLTKSVVGVFSLGILATSWSIGQASDTNGFTSNYAGVAAGGSPSETPAPDGSATPSSSAAPNATATTKATPTPTPTKTSAPTKKTKTGDPQSYRYGVIQVTVTKSGGKITDITLDQAGATGGRQAAFDPLVNAAIQAQGSNFGNVSQATFTTETFKVALESALAKF